MNCFTLPQGLEIVQLFYQNSRSFVAIQRVFSTIHGCHSAPSVIAICRIIEKLESVLFLNDNKPLNRRTSSYSKETLPPLEKVLKKTKMCSFHVVLKKWFFPLTLQGYANSKT